MKDKIIAKQDELIENYKVNFLSSPSIWASNDIRLESELSALKAEAEEEVNNEEINKFISEVDLYQFNNYYEAIEFCIKAHRDNLIKKGE